MIMEEIITKVKKQNKNNLKEQHSAYFATQDETQQD